MFKPTNEISCLYNFGVYYNKKNSKSNIISSLPPVEEGCGARVGYFRTEPNELYFSIPTNENILY